MELKQIITTNKNKQKHKSMATIIVINRWITHVLPYVDKTTQLIKLRYSFKTDFYDYLTLTLNDYLQYHYVIED